MSRWDDIRVEQPDTAEANGRVGGAAEDTMRSRFLTIDQLRTLPKPEWRLDSIIPDRATGMVFGKGGSLKTFLVLDWALSIGAGRAWEALGAYQTKQGDAIYVAGEGAWGMPARVTAWEEWNKHRVGSGILWYPEPVNLYRREQVELFARAIAPKEPKLIVFDTLAKCAVGADENSSKDMGIVHDSMGWLNRTFDSGTLVIHHNTKDGAGYRGSSALYDNVDWAASVERSGDDITVKCEKQKDAAPFPDIPLEMVVLGESCVLRGRGHNSSGHQGADTLLRVVSTVCSLEALSANRLFEMAGEQLNVGRSKFYMLLNGLVSKGFVENLGTEKNGKYRITRAGQALVVSTCP